MKPTVIALTLATLSLFWGPESSALAQDAKVARGTITAISGQWVTLKVAGQDMKFNVDTKTTVEARGGSTKAARAAATGKPGPHLADLLQPGQPVAVTYNDMAGALHATAIKTIAKAPAAVNASANGEMRSSGIVKSMGGDWITINGSSGGGASFEQTFKIAPATKVFAKGASTATAARGGKVPFADIVANGDRVTVSYHQNGNALLASDVHVTIRNKRASH